MGNLPRSLHIIADENIPVGSDRMPRWAAVRFLPAAEIRREVLSGADALLVRSVTRVDEDLLEGTPVSYVGTATTGTDHVDLAYLSKRGIAFADAAGSNADSVVDYVLATLGVICRRERRRLDDLTVGIVGVGRIGGRLAERLYLAGAKVLLCDPPRHETEGGAFQAMERVLSDADVISLHVPLTTEGVFPTHHLIDEKALRSMRRGAWLINTSRGAVVNNRSLRSVLEGGAEIRVALDVWEGEPVPDIELLRMVDIATPHIAGYAFDGKIRGAQMVMDALAAHVGRTIEERGGASGDGPVVSLPDAWLPETDAFVALATRMYDVESDDRRMRSSIGTSLDSSPAGSDIAAAFAALRRTYPVRREFGFHTLRVPATPGHARVVAALGIGRSQTR